MDGVPLVLTVMVVGGGILLVRHFWRRHQAARLADQLLNDAVKAKDAFRR